MEVLASPWDDCVLVIPVSLLLVADVGILAHRFFLIAFLRTISAKTFLVFVNSHEVLLAFCTELVIKSMVFSIKENLNFSTPDVLKIKINDETSFYQHFLFLLPGNTRPGQFGHQVH